MFTCERSAGCYITESDCLTIILDTTSSEDLQICMQCPKGKSIAAHCPLHNKKQKNHSKTALAKLKLLKLYVELNI